MYLLINICINYIDHFRQTARNTQTNRKCTFCKTYSRIKTLYHRYSEHLEKKKNIQKITACQPVWSLLNIWKQKSPLATHLSLKNQGVFYIFWSLGQPPLDPHEPPRQQIAGPGPKTGCVLLMLAS